jgi:ABC-2 type transport system ATP-binding protein
MRVLELRGVQFGYANKVVLEALNLNLDAGQIAAIMGGNGAGKSTLLKLCLGFERPQQGTIRLTQSLLPAGDLETKSKVAYVPEKVAVYGHLSGWENLRYFLALGGEHPSDSAVQAAFRRVQLPESAWHSRASDYSKGMRQKVVLALATLRASELLLLDEPTSGLDPHAIKSFHRLVGSLAEQGTAILMVTHDLYGATQIADQLYFLAEHKLLKVPTELRGEAALRYLDSAYSDASAVLA